MSSTQPTLIGFFLSPFGAPILIILAISLGALIWGSLGMQAAHAPRRTARQRTATPTSRTATFLLWMGIVCGAAALAIAAFIPADILGAHPLALFGTIAALSLCTALGLISSALLIGQAFDTTRPRPGRTFRQRF